MKVFNVVQGGPEWLELRDKYHCASDAPAMRGTSTKLQRNELVRMLATGATREFSVWVQTNLLDKGHEIEAMARPLAEEIIG